MIIDSCNPNAILFIIMNFSADTRFLSGSVYLFNNLCLTNSEDRPSSPLLMLSTTLWSLLRVYSPMEMTYPFLSKLVFSSIKDPIASRSAYIVFVDFVNLCSRATISCCVFDISARTGWQSSPRR